MTTDYIKENMSRVSIVDINGLILGYIKQGMGDLICRKTIVVELLKIIFLRKYGIQSVIYEIRKGHNYLSNHINSEETVNHPLKISQYCVRTIMIIIISGVKPL